VLLLRLLLSDNRLDLVELGKEKTDEREDKNDWSPDGNIASLLILLSLSTSLILLLLLLEAYVELLILLISLSEGNGAICEEDEEEEKIDSEDVYLYEVF
jgi:hypothetical protein